MTLGGLAAGRQLACSSIWHTASGQNRSLCPMSLDERIRPQWNFFLGEVVTCQEARSVLFLFVGMQSKELLAR